MAAKKKSKKLKTRDHLMVKIINGSTKAGVHKDEKKEASKLLAREKVDLDTGYCIRCDTELFETDHEYFQDRLCAFCSILDEDNEE